MGVGSPITFTMVDILKVKYAHIINRRSIRGDTFFEIFSNCSIIILSSSGILQFPQILNSLMVINRISNFLTRFCVSILTGVTRIMSGMLVY